MWMAGSRGTETERGERWGRAWNVAVGTGRPVYLMSARQAGSVTQTGSGLLSEALNFKEKLISLLQWSSIGQDHREENTEQGKRKRWQPRLEYVRMNTELCSEVMTIKKTKTRSARDAPRSLLEIGITVNRHASSAMERGDVSAVLGS